MRRRTFLLSLLGGGAAVGGIAAYRGLHALPPRDPDADARFQRLQSALLHAEGVPAVSRFLDVPRPPLRVHVIEAGAGDPVVLIHGGNSVAIGWLPLLARLHSRFHLFAPDRPGCGLTTMFDYQGVDLRAHAVAFVTGLLDGLGLPRATLLANSMGGFFALAFAIAEPARVSKLVLLGEPAGSGVIPSRFHRMVGTRMLNTLLYSTVMRPPTDAAGMRKGLARAGLVADPGRVSEALLECLAAGARLPGAVVSWITMVERVFAPAGVGVFATRTTATWALRPELRRITAPTLFLWGDKDPLGTPDVGRELSALMPRARVEVVPDAGHLPWLDQPDFCAKQIVSFLAL
jgi:pimeloyl-ACP methyl ester carboxylesterase